MWLTCLKFLSELKGRELETATSTRSSSYFHTLTNTFTINQENMGNQEYSEEDSKKRKSKSRGR